IVSASPEISALNEIIFSTPLETIFPSIAQLSRDIVRVSYATADGMFRTFPPVQPADVAPDWTIETNEALLLGGPEQNPQRQLIWQDVHQVFGGQQQVVAAITPIYRRDRFIGVVVVDISADRLTDVLTNVVVGGSGFPLVLDRSRKLIATTEQGQQVLLGSTGVSREEQRKADLTSLNPGLAPMLQGLDPARGTTMQVSLGGKDYLLAAAPVDFVSWQVMFAYPLDDIAATSRETGALMRESARTTLLANFGIIALVTIIIASLLLYLLRRQLVRPLGTLIEATRAISAGSLKPIDMPYNDEMGQLAQSFNTMSQAINESRQEILATNQRLEQAVAERTAELQGAVEQTTTMLSTQQELVATLNRVSSPLIPVLPGVLVMPLVGQLSEERMQFATQELLQRIETSRVHLVLFDLTGVPVLDAPAAQSLQRAVAASQLLGARMMLVGIAPEVAQTLVMLGLDPRNVATAADLQTAIGQVLRQTGLRSA
ncbi:MAG TPA: STAS domain-containing protein, partial [Herpetosiphonaceae bacterium]